MKKWACCVCFGVLSLVLFAGHGWGGEVEHKGDQPTVEEISFVTSLQKAVKQEDWTWIADHIDFSITVRVNGKIKKLNDKSEFLEYRQAVFNNRVRQAVLDQNPNDLFKNWQGVMIGRGEVWISGRQMQGDDHFTLCIVAINNE